MNIKPNVGGCMHCGHDHFNRNCLTCHDTDGPCRAMLQWEVKVLGASLAQKVEMLSARVEPPEPQPDLEVTIKSLHNTIEGLRNQLDDARQTERDLDAEVAKLTRENTRLTKLAWEAQKKVEALEARNDELSRDAGTLIGVRALNEALTQKQHQLEADNKALRASSSEIAAIYEDRLESIRAATDSLVALLERLGFNVFRPGHDACDND